MLPICVLCGPETSVGRPAGSNADCRDGRFGRGITGRIWPNTRLLTHSPHRVFLECGKKEFVPESRTNDTFSFQWNGNITVQQRPVYVYVASGL